MNPQRMLAVIFTVTLLFGSTSPLLVSATPAPATSEGGSGRSMDPYDFGGAITVWPSTGGTTLTGSGSGATDVYQFYRVIAYANGTSRDRIDVLVTCDDTPCQGTNRLSVWDPDLYWIQSNPINGPADATHFTPEHTGWFYVRVETQGPFLNYSVTFTRTTVVIPVDANNSPTNTSTITFDGSGQAQVLGTMDNYNDYSDFFVVNLIATLTDTDILSVRVDAPDGDDFVTVELYEPAGAAPIDQLNPEGEQVTNASVRSSYRMADFAPPITGDYLLRVWGVKGDGPYRLTLLRAIATTDSDNDAASCTPVLATGHSQILTGTVGNGGLGASIDATDFYCFTGHAGTIVNATMTTSLFNGSLGTPNLGLELHSETGQIPGSSLQLNDYVVDPEGEVSAILQDEGTFYVVPHALGGAGDYSIDLLVNTPPTPLQGDPMVLELTENEVASFDLATYFEDLDGDTWDYAIIGSHPNVTFTVDDVTKNLTAEPEANFSLTAQTCLPASVTDAAGGVLDTQLCFTIEGVNHVPYIVPGTPNPGGVTLAQGVVDSTLVDLADIFTDRDVADKHHYLVWLHDGASLLPATEASVQVSFPIETPQTPERWNTGEVTLIAPVFPTVETLCFKSEDAALSLSPCYDLVVTVPATEYRISSTHVPDQTIEEDSSVVVDLAKYLKWKPSPPEGDSLQFTVSTDTEPLGLSLAGNGTLTIDPDPNWCGSGNITYGAHGTVRQVSNNNTSLVVVTCINDPPAITATSPTTPPTVAEGANVTLSVTVEDVDTIPALLLYGWSVDNASVPGSAGEYVYAPGYEAAGNHTVCAEVNDTQHAANACWHVVVTPTNRAPTGVDILKPVNGTTFTTKSIVTLEASQATDPDGDELFYTWYDGSVSGASKIGQGRNAQANKLGAGTHTIILVVSDRDSGGLEMQDTVVVNVKKPAKPQPGFELPAALVAIVAVAALLQAARRKTDP